MTIKKAIKIIDWWINHKTQSMEKLLEQWNYNPDKPSEVEQLLIKSNDTDLYNLKAIRAQLVPKCRHPKKMIDTLPNGQKYCMNCNFDL